MSRLVVLLALVLAACSASAPAIEPGPSVDTSPAAAATPSDPPAAPESADPDGVRLPAYVGSVRPIGSALRDRMASSHRRGCPLRWADLRHLRITYVGFDGRAHIGEMVVHRDHAQDVTGVFEALYEARWPISQMRLVDDFEADDDRSMAANNTSGYNCRRVAGGDSWSTHAYGAAIDINPVQNPYVTRDSIVPPAGRAFAAIDRAAQAAVPIGVIREADVVVRAFAGIGWQWGGTWVGSKDYQHFSATGR